MMRAIDEAARETQLTGQRDTPPTAPTAPTAPATPPAEAPTPNADAGAPGGPEPPPPPPTASYPVPPVPPPPIQVGIAGGPSQLGGAAGPSTFARVGSEAAAPYRTAFFSTNRVQGAGGNMPAAPPARFGPGAPTVAGAAPATFFDAFGGGDGSNGGSPNSDEDLARLIAAIASRRAR